MTGEKLGPEHKGAGVKSFICTDCSSDVEACHHSAAGCAKCDELVFFKDDVDACIATIEAAPDELVSKATKLDLRARAERLKGSIDFMVGHVARVTVQDRFWGDVLQGMRDRSDYTHVALKSDYWAKFEVITHTPLPLLFRNHTQHTHMQGAAFQWGKCQNRPKQSVETHSAWYLIPPADSSDTDWSVFPAGVSDIKPDSAGFRGFVVEFYNIVSDIVVQDGYQSILNLRTVLRLIKARHERIETCTRLTSQTVVLLDNGMTVTRLYPGPYMNTRDSDGATSYNSTFVALFTLLMKGETGIKVTDHGHNEGGHGSDICDAAGATLPIVINPSSGSQLTQTVLLTLIVSRVITIDGSIMIKT